MSLIRRLILSLILAAGLGPALAQAPAPVPALPDSERRTSYSISGTTCACNVNFALYGDSTDFQNWVEVWLNGVNIAFNDSTKGWTITSPSGSLSNLARPITDAVLTFTAVQTGTVQIVGARRPRRTTQFSESGGVSARNLNQAFTDVISQNREIWDKTNDMTGRAVLGLPGETVGPLPALASRASNIFGFDGSGNPVAISPSIGLGTVVGPASSIDGHVVVFNGVTGKLIKDGGPSVGTVTSVTQGNGLSFTVTPCVTSCTVSLSNTPTLGASGTLGTLSFGNATSGTIKLQPVAGALGTPTITLPAASGTIAISASSPLALDVSGNLTCCSPSTGTGNVVFATSPTITGGTFSNMTITPPLNIGGGSATSHDPTYVASRTISAFDAGGHHTFADNAIYTSSGTDAADSFDSFFTVTGANNYNHFAGVQTRANLGTSGTTTNLYGLVDLPTLSAGTLTNRYGVSIWDVTNFGTITSNYGVYVKALSTGASNFAIYTEAPTAVQFGGPVTHGISGSAGGSLILQGLTSGSVTVKVAAAVGSSINFQLPSSNGASGQLLSSDGSGNTSWVTASGTGTVTSVTQGSGLSFSTSPCTSTCTITNGSGNKVLLATLTAANSASLADTTSLTSTYNQYLIVFDKILPATAATICRLRVNIAGVQTTNYLSYINQTDSGASNTVVTSTTYINCGGNNNLQNSGPGITGEIRVHEPSQTAVSKYFWGQVAYQAQALDAGAVVYGRYTGGAGAVTGIEVSMTSGNITSGTIRIYGILN